jgi:hypothetical protein
VGVSNVYEYEPNGAGTCTAAPACISILSSATSHQESAFIDADETGDNVFFVTAAPLVPAVSETSYHVYDARVCGAESPCVPAAGAKAETCVSSGTCKGPAETVGAFTPPSSASDGIGNSTGGVLHEVKEKPPVKKLTRAQLLKKALASCKSKHKHSKKKRQSCERAAHKKYGPKPKPKHKSGKKG